MISEERLVGEWLGQIGLPDDLVEVALNAEPSPSSELAAQMKQQVLQRAVGRQRVSVPTWYRWAVAAAVVALLAVAAVGPARVMAQVQALFSFVPGFGMQKAESFLLYSPGPVEIAYRGGAVEVPGLMATETQITVRLVMRDLKEWGPTGKMRLEDDFGHRFSEYSASGVARVLYWEQWLTFSGRVDAKTRTLTLVIPDGAAELRIPVPLVKAAGADPLKPFGPSATANGLQVSAQVRSRPDRTEATLLLLGSVQLVEGLGSPAPWAVEGELTSGDRTVVISQESGGLGQMRTLSADPLPAGADRVRLSLKNITVAEVGAATLTVNTVSGPVDQSVRLGRWDLLVTRTERSGDTLRVYLDLGPLAPTSLWGIRNIGLLRESSEVGIGTVRESGRLAWFDLKLLHQSETVTLQLSDPEVRIEGPWVIDGPVQRQ